MLQQTLDLKFQKQSFFKIFEGNRKDNLPYTESIILMMKLIGLELNSLFTCWNCKQEALYVL